MIKPYSTIEKLRKGENVTIVALGDSLTYGWMVQKGFLDYLYEMLLSTYPQAKITIINKGIPGDTADGGLHRLSYDVIPYKPHCVFVEFALNDYACGYTPTIFGNYIEAIITNLQQIQCDIVLITSVWFGDFPEAHRAYRLYNTLESIAAKYSLPIAKTHELWKSAIEQGTPLNELVQFDGVHPTEEGYELMAQAVYNLFT